MTHIETPVGASTVESPRVPYLGVPQTPVVFSRPFRSRRELENLGTVLNSDHVHGDGAFTAAATAKLKAITGATDALLTTSCTHALEMASILLDLKPGDEVVIPSFTFSSAAAAIVSRGAVPVFVDIDEANGNVDVGQLAEAIGPKTKALSVVHYGGVAAEMDDILAIANEAGLPVIEDNAHGLGGTYRGRSLGTMGMFGTQSFHDTKNVHCGEGGAILVNDPAMMERAEIVREKGTDRSRFLRGQVDKYTWNDQGSSYLLSELNAAVLDSQLEQFEEIQALRHHIWDTYAAELGDWADQQRVRLMSVPDDREHTAHLFYLSMPTHDDQVELIAHLRAQGISAPFHYVPLDSSPAGQKFGRTLRPLPVTESFSRRLVRLPLWAGLSDEQLERVVDGVTSFRALG